MLIGGFQKLTLIDYPGKLATTVFTVGCDFRCSFCHNPELVLSIHHRQFSNMEDDFFDFLKKRIGKIEGVCVSGGEPTIHPDLVPFLEKIKNMGFLVKLDTNGINPEKIIEAIENNVIDYIAMDIKQSKKKYAIAAGKDVDLVKIDQSAHIIMASGIDYEFRTTVVPGIHTEEDFLDIAEWIKGAKKYYLQIYRDLKILDPNLKKISKGKFIDINLIRQNIAPFVEKIGIRG